MIKKRELTENLTIKEAFSLFDEEKLAEGINSDGFFSELNRLMDENDLCLDDYVSVISESMVNKYIISLRNRGLAVASINHYLSILRTFLNWCFRHEYVLPFKIKMVKGQEEQLKFATDEEIAKLLKVLKPNDFCEMRTYTIICFILATGARSSTIRNIRVDDIDFKNHTVVYRHLKNKKVAVIPLTSQIERILHGYIRTWDTQSDFLFPDIKGGQLTSGALKLSFAHYCKRRNMDTIYPHALRHTFSRLFIKNGGNAFVLQQMLTHSSLEMTRRYVKLFSDDIRDNKFDSYNPLSVISNNKSRTKVVTRNV